MAIDNFALRPYGCTVGILVVKVIVLRQKYMLASGVKGDGVLGYSADIDK
jgi:hypothetical protein